MKSVGSYMVVCIVVLIVVATVKCSALRVSGVCVCFYR